MIKFIIYEDDEKFKESIKRVIDNLMLPMTVEYRVSLFSKYDKQLEITINEFDNQKIYILAIEVGNVSGLDLARKIRDNDWKSIIIVISAHYDLIYNALRTRLMLLDFISKFDNYEKNLLESIKIALKVIDVRNVISIEYAHRLCKIDLENILYLTTDTEKRRSIIITHSENFYSNMSLCKIKNHLPDCFQYSHRACIINNNNVKRIDLRNKLIIFKSNEKLELLSEKYKKDIIKKFK